MTDDTKVRLVVLGGATTAPVCEGDVCYLPDSTVDSTVDPAGPGMGSPTLASPAEEEHPA